jgi:hypothetical protein
MPALGCIVTAGLGLFQFAAIMAELVDGIGLHWIIAGPAAMLLASVPLVGTILGIFGAVNVWGWAWWQAALLFFGWFAFAAAAGGVAGLAGLAQSFFGRRTA